MASGSKSQRAASAAGRPARKGRQRARLNIDPEQSTRLLLIGAVVGIVAVAAAVIGFGYWYTVIRPRYRTVLQVDNVKVSYTAIKRRMAYELLQNPSYAQSQSALQTLPQATLTTLEDEIVIDLEANSDQKLGVTNADFTNALYGALGISTTSDSRTFADALKKQLDSTGLTDSEYRRMVRARLLTQKLTAKFTNEVPAKVMQAKVDVIETNNESDAQKAADRVKAGEDWATVAKSVSIEPNVASTGGIHDYAPQGTFDPTYDAQAFSAKIGDVTAPLPSSSGTYFVIRVEGRAEKPVTASQKPQLAQKALVDWLTKMEGELKIKQDFDSTSQNNALNSVFSATLPKLVAQQKQQQQQQQAQQTAAAKITPAAQGTPQPTAAAAQPTAAAASPAPSAPAPGGGNGR